MALAEPLEAVAALALGTFITREEVISATSTKAEIQMVIGLKSLCILFDILYLRIFLSFPINFQHWVL